MAVGEETKKRHTRGYLGAFEKITKTTTSFVTYVRLSARNNSAPTGRIFVKFYISVFFRKSVQKIQVSLKSDKNDGYCA